MSCAARLRRDDIEVTRAMWDDAEPKFGTQSASKAAPSNGRKQTMTQQDIMRNYKK